VCQAARYGAETLRAIEKHQLREHVRSTTSIDFRGYAAVGPAPGAWTCCRRDRHERPCCPQTAARLGLRPEKARIRKVRTQQRLSMMLMVPPARLERATPRSTIWCSNQLS
jgi:hypothetical protein